MKSEVDMLYTAFAACIYYYYYYCIPMCYYYYYYYYYCIPMCYYYCWSGHCSSMP